LPITLASGGNITLRAGDAIGNPFDIALNGAVGGSGGFTKLGDGTLTLDGTVTHAFTGAAAVNAGTLRVTGTLGTATNAVAINSGAMLAGNGAINRPVALNNGGTLAPDTPSAAL